MKPEAISKLLKLALALCCMVSISVGYVCVTPVLADDSKLTASSDPGELRDFVGRMEKRIKSDPRPEFFTAKAQALEWLKRYSESTKAYSKAIDLDSGDSYLFFARGRVLRKQGLWRQAESDLTKAISIGYSTAEVFGNRALVRLSLKDYEGALVDSRRAINMNSREPLDWYAKGSSERHLGHYKDALNSLTKALELEPNDPICLRVRAIVFEKLGRIEDAEADVKKAISFEAPK